MVNSVDEIDIDLLIDRSSLGLADLNLSVEDMYGVVDFGPGAVVKNRRTVRGPYTSRIQMRGWTINERTLIGIVRVYGSSWPQCRARAVPMYRALDQRSYEITSVMDGVTDVYQCMPADITPGASGTWQKAQMMARMQEYTLSIPYDPIGSSL